MGKVVDITDKLSFEENPKLIVKGKELEVNADAPTMLKVMGLMGEKAGTDEILKAYDMLFTQKAKKEIEAMKLNFNDLIVVIQEAIVLITGEGESQKERGPVL